MQHLRKSYHHPSTLKPFFEPESVAVIGASRTPNKAGHNIIENLQRIGYPGRVYPINPQAKQILGTAVYPALKDLPEVPDLALIVLPPSLVLKSLEECAAVGVKAAIIETAGFGELGEDGLRDEAEIVRLARAAGMRVMGPNSIGTINPRARFDASFARLNRHFLPESPIRSGTTAFVGQTGLLTGVFLPLINGDIGISKVACLGNKSDVDESDFLEYLGDDPTTEVIAMYLESIKDGRRFMDLCRRIVKDKPIIVLKSAVTAAGATASASHTGSLAGTDAVYDAAFRQVGVVRVGSFEQLFDAAKAFVMAPLPRGNRVGIINVTGAGCVTTVDACARSGLTIAELSPATKASLKEVYPDWWDVRSPLDVWTAVEASGFEKAYTTITRATMADEGVDAVICIMGAINWDMPSGRDVPGLFREIKSEFPAKTFMAVDPLGDRKIYERLGRGFQELGIPHYLTPEDAVAALAAMWQYQQYRRRAD